MFKRIVRAIMARGTESKCKSTKSKKCKQESKRNYIPATDEGGRNFTQTTKSERGQMANLYRQSHSINIIATKLGRSTRTVHQALTGRGSHPLPERNYPPTDADNDDDTEPTRQVSRRRRKLTHGNINKVEVRDSIFEQVGPILTDMAVEHLKDNPEFALQVAASLLDIKLQKPSLDDIAMGIIKEDPDYRRQWAETYLERLRRNGRTEMDIFAEGLEIMRSMSEFIHKPTSIPDVLSEAVRTGELRKIVELLAQQVGRPEPSPAEPASVPESLPTPESVLPESAPALPSLPPEVDPSSKQRRQRFLHGLSPEARQKLLETLKSSVLPESISSSGSNTSQDPVNSGKLPCGKGLEDIDLANVDGTLSKPVEPDPS